MRVGGKGEGTTSVERGAKRIVSFQERKGEKAQTVKNKGSGKENVQSYESIASSQKGGGKKGWGDWLSVTGRRYHHLEREEQRVESHRLRV